MDRAFSPYAYARFSPRPLPNLLLRRKSGVGLGWYSGAPSALGLAEESATGLDHCIFFVRLALMGLPAWVSSFYILKSETFDESWGFWGVTALKLRVRARLLV